MSTGKVFLGLLAGVAVGATLGLLFAPDKGASTRKKISKRSSDFTKEMEDKLTSFLDTIKDKAESVKEEVTSAVENGKVKVKEKIS